MHFFTIEEHFQENPCHTPICERWRSESSISEPSILLTGSITGKNNAGKTVINGVTGAAAQRGTVIVAAASVSATKTTSGDLTSAVALLKEGHVQTDDDIREWMSGNICRCGAYPNIVAAVRDVAGQGKKG